MADWIKVNHSLVRSAKIRLLARELKTKPLTALGLAVRWLVWIDEQTTDGHTFLKPEDVDDELGFRGGAAALCSIGWASLDDEGCVVALDFEQHNGVTAKRRAMDARRQRSSRALRDMCHAQSVTDVTGDVTVGALPVENRREYMTLSAGARVCEPAPLPDEVLPVMAALNLGNLQGEAISECVTRFIDEMEASGWCDRRGVPLHDWRAAARNWARRYAERLSMTSRNDSKNSRQRKDCNNADDYR